MAKSWLRRNFISNVAAGLSAGAEDSWGLKWLRLVFVGALITFLVWRLSEIGWAEVRDNLPSKPLYFILFLCGYLTLPLAESMIYGWLWNVKPRRLIAPALKKRVFNKDVLGYSGEVYLFAWARDHIALPARQLLHVIKDNNIVSSISSTSVAVVLLTVFVVTGQVAIPAGWLESRTAAIILVVLAVIVIVVLFIRFSSSILYLPMAVLRKLFGIHVGRLILVQSFTLMQWMVVMPEVPLKTWLTYLCVLIIITRIPLMPSRDLIFMSIGIEMSGMVSVSQAGIAGLLLVASVLDKVLNLVVYSILSIRDRRSGVDRQSEIEEAGREYLDAISVVEEGSPAK